MLKFNSTTCLFQNCQLWSLGGTIIKTDLPFETLHIKKFQHEQVRWLYHELDQKQKTIQYVITDIKKQQNGIVFIKLIIPTDFGAL